MGVYPADSGTFVPLFTKTCSKAPGVSCGDLMHDGTKRQTFINHEALLGLIQNGRERLQQECPGQRMKVSHAIMLNIVYNNPMSLSTIF